MRESLDNLDDHVSNTSLTPRGAGIKQQSFKRTNDRKQTQNTMANVDMQALIEENNELKMQKRILEKEIMSLQKKLEEGRLEKIVVSQNSSEAKAMALLRSEIESKNSLIYNLEHDKSELKSANHLLQMTSDFMKEELNKLSEELGEVEELHDQLEEVQDELRQTKKQLEKSEDKERILKQQSQLLQKEIIRLKTELQKKKEDDEMNQNVEDLEHSAGGFSLGSRKLSIRTGKQNNDLQQASASPLLATRSKFSLDINPQNFTRPLGLVDIGNKAQTDQGFQKNIAYSFEKNIYLKALHNVARNVVPTSIESIKERILLEKVKNKILQSENSKLKDMLEIEYQNRLINNEEFESSESIVIGDGAAQQHT